MGEAFKLALYAVASPYDELDWGATLAPELLVPGEAIESIAFEARSEDLAAGIVLEPRPSETDPVYGLIGYVLVSIAAAQRDNQRFDGRGYVARPLVTITTNKDRIWARELPLLFVRSAAAALATLTSLLAAIGEPTTKRGWPAAFRIPDTSWIGGIDGAPPVAFGLVGAEPPADGQRRAEWRARVAERIEAAMAVTESAKLDAADVRAS